ncbi:MAG: ComF family protein [Muribaculaceae bacterium]
MGRVFELARDVAGVIAPARCVVCGETLAAGEDFMCVQCLWAMPRTFAHRRYISELADPLARIIPDACFASWFRYRTDRPYHRIIHNIKYLDCPKLGVSAGAQFARELKPDGFFDGIDLIVPIPIPALRRFVRGYNQAEMIARGVGEETGIPIAKILTEGFFRRSQVGLGSATRRANMSEARFTVKNAVSLSGKHLLLVDDVITTGSTMHSAALALKKARPDIARISFLSLAMSDAGF